MLIVTETDLGVMSYLLIAPSIRRVSFCLHNFKKKVKHTLATLFHSTRLVGLRGVYICSYRLRHSRSAVSWKFVAVYVHNRISVLQRVREISYARTLNIDSSQKQTSHKFPSHLQHAATEIVVRNIKT